MAPKMIRTDLNSVLLYGRPIYYSHWHEYGLERRDLRYAMLGLLLQAGRPLKIADIGRQLRARYKIASWVSQRTIADALAHECSRGRARRVGRGVYVPAVMSPSMRRRVAERVAMVQCCASSPAEHLTDSY